MFWKEMPERERKNLRAHCSSAGRWLAHGLEPLMGLQVSYKDISHMARGKGWGAEIAQWMPKIPERRADVLCLTYTVFWKIK